MPGEQKITLHSTKPAPPTSSWWVGVDDFGSAWRKRAVEMGTNGHSFVDPRTLD